VGVLTPQGAVTDQKMIDRHNKFRVHKENIKKSIEYHSDYHIKPVLDKDFSILDEVEEFIKDLEIPDEKIWAMPAGDTRESLFESYPKVMDFVRDRGWRFTGRAHIMAFNDQREV
jgi:7-carboxy-7-deazaguanine synthase